MSSYLLCRGNNLYGPHIEGDQGALLDPKGAVISCRMQADGHGAAEVPPLFVRVNVDTLLENVEDYTGAWVRAVDWSVVDSNLTTDTFRLDIGATNPGGGQGNLPLSDIESVLSDWSFAVQSVAGNSIVADINVYDALVSRGFLGDLVDAMTFTELSYTGGVHRIQVDYSAITRQISKAVDQTIRDKGGTIVSHTGKVCVYEMSRADATNKLKAALQAAGNREITKRRYIVAEAIIDQALSGGGDVSLSLATLQANITDLSA